MYRAYTNAQGSKLDLALKKAKSLHRTIILAILVDLPSPMICAKIRPQGLFSSGEDFIYMFLPYMGMAAILVNGLSLF